MQRPAMLSARGTLGGLIFVSACTFSQELKAYIFTTFTKDMVS